MTTITVATITIYVNKTVRMTMTGTTAMIMTNAVTKTMIITMVATTTMAKIFKKFIACLKSYRRLRTLNLHFFFKK